MGRIQEYEQQVGAPDPIGPASPNLEAVGAGGDALARVGAQIAETGGLIQRRQEAMETSNIYASMADKRAELADTIQTQSSDGTIDPQKLRDDYEDWVQKQADQYQTPGGKNYFNRQAARLGGTMLTKAIKGKAIAAANQAKSDLSEGLNKYGATVEGDPDQFEDALAANMEHLDQLVSQGTVPAKDAPKFREAMGTQLAQSAIRGYIDQDPDQAEAALNSGSFDKYLNAPQRRQMETEIRQGRTAAEIEASRQDNLDKKAIAAKQEQWGQSALPKLLNNSLTTKEILASPGTWEDKHKWLQMVKEQGAMESKSDPKVVNDVYARALLPSNDPNHISDISQVIGMNGVSAHDIPGINSWLGKTPDGEALRTNKKLLLDYARANLVGGNFFTGQKDPDGQYRLAQFTTSLQAKERELRDAKKPVAGLYDPSSPDYFGKSVVAFKPTAQDIITKQADIARKSIPGGTAPPPAGTIYTPPGVVPQPVEQLGPDEVVRITKDGRKGIYNSKTKAFIKYSGAK